MSKLPKFEDLVDELPDSTTLVEDGSIETTPTGLPQIVQKGAQVITTPERGMRGVGVGTERLLEGVSPATFIPPQLNINPQDFITAGSQMVQNAPNALERAAEAVQPGFVPQEGEKIGSAIGSTVGALPLATAMSGVGAGSLGAFGRNKILATILAENPKIIFQALRNAGAGIALSSIEQASERGDVKLVDVATVAGTGAMLPFIKPTGEFITRYIKSLGRDVVTGTTSVSVEAAQEAMNNPNLLKQARGTAEAVSNRAVRIQRVLKNTLDEAGEAVSKARESFGIEKDFDEWLKDTTENGLRHTSPKDVTRDYSELMAGKKIEEIPKVILNNGILTPTTKNVVSDIPYKERIRDLYRLRKEIGEYVNWSKTRQDLPPIGSFDEKKFKDMRFKINELLNEYAKTDPAVRRLRDSDDMYYLGRDLYDDLQKNLSTKGKAEQTLMRIAKKDSIEDILGTSHDVIDLVKKLEKSSKIKLLEPLRKEVHAENIRGVKAKPTGFFTTVIGPGFEGMKGRGTANYLGTVGRFTSLTDRILELANNPAAKAAIIAGASNKVNK